MRRKDQMDLEDYISVGKRYDRLSQKGREVVDSTPMAPPVGYKKSPSIQEQLRAMVVRELAAREALKEQGFETFEEADDFEIADDPVDPGTPYEMDFDPVGISELRRRAAADLDRQGAPEAPAEGGGEAGLDGPKT